MLDTPEQPDLPARTVLESMPRLFVALAVSARIHTRKRRKPLKARRRFLGLLFAAALSAGAAVVPLSAAHATTGYYTMQLSPASAAIQAGDTTSITVSFHASRHLRHLRLDLSVSGLPSGVTASFSPATPRIGGTSTLTLTAAPSSSAGAVALTVNAITIDPSDPIGTSTAFDLTVNAP